MFRQPIRNHRSAPVRNVPRRSSGRTRNYQALGRPVTHDADLTVEVDPSQRRECQSQRFVGVDAPSTRTDQRKRQGTKAFTRGKLHGISNGFLNRSWRRSPQEPDTGDVNDRPMRKSASARKHRRAERKDSATRKLSERVEPGSAFDRAGYALGKQKPPGEKIAVPRVDECIDVLVEQITVEHDGFHDLETPLNPAAFPDL